MFNLIFARGGDAPHLKYITAHNHSQAFEYIRDMLGTGWILINCETI